MQEDDKPIDGEEHQAAKIIREKYIDRWPQIFRECTSTAVISKDD